MNENRTNKIYQKLNIKFWGDYNRYSRICQDNPIMQNVLQSCYKTPRSKKDIGKDIGVDDYYVNYAVSKLCECGLLQLTPCGYQTTVLILSKESMPLTNELIKIQKDLAAKIYAFVEEHYLDFFKIVSFDRSVEKNETKWRLYSLILYIGLIEKFQLKAELERPLSTTGNRGFVWAEEQDLTDIYGNVNVCNIINNIGDKLHIIEYSKFGEPINNYFNNNHYDDILFQIARTGKVTLGEFSKRDMLDIAQMSKLHLIKYDQGNIFANISVYSNFEYQRIRNYLREITSEVAKQSYGIFAKIMVVLQEHTPSNLAEQTKSIAALQMFNCVYAPTMHYLHVFNQCDEVQTTNILISFIECAK